jgi:hypothetical protein
VQGFEGEVDDLDEAEPFVPGGSPQATGGAVVADDVDLVVTHGVPDGVELYLWTLGKGQLAAEAFLTEDLTDSALHGVDIPAGSCRLEGLIRPPS